MTFGREPKASLCPRLERPEGEQRLGVPDALDLLELIGDEIAEGLVIGGVELHEEVPGPGDRRPGRADLRRRRHLS